jgi:hypothetical protein
MSAAIDLKINLLSFASNLKFRPEPSGRLVFDPVRKGYFRASKEELVRQCIILFLSEKLGYRTSLMAVEKSLQLNDLKRRFDLLVYASNHLPAMLVELKNPEVPVSQDTFRQIAAYNLALKVPFLLVSNGIQTYCCAIDFAKAEFQFLDAVPAYH